MTKKKDDHKHEGSQTVKRDHLGTTITTKCVKCGKLVWSAFKRKKK